MTQREAAYPILPMFLDRWSPRAFARKPIGEETLKTVVEAARWAPSSMNYQPWRFVYALNGDTHWDSFLAALVPGNQLWAANASALIFVVSDTILEAFGNRGLSHSHSFDSGAAWMAMALQAHSMGLITHGMTGVDFDAAAKVVDLPEEFRVEAAIAIGYQGDPADLPEQVRVREIPSDRRPISESLFAGTFPS